MGTGLASMWGGARGESSAVFVEEPIALVPEDGYVAAVSAPSGTASWRFWEA